MKFNEGYRAFYVVVTKADSIKPIEPAPSISEVCLYSEQQ